MSPAPTRAQKLVQSILRSLLCPRVPKLLRDGQNGGNKMLLMVDYYFPPLGGTGVRRTLGWAKYLCEHGWSPLVLTVCGGDAPFADQSLNNHIPANVTVCRVPSIEPVGLAKQVLRRRFADAAEGIGAIHVHGTYHLDWLRRLIPWLFFPDRRIGWFAPAIVTGISILRSHPIDLIYSTYSDTISAHLVAYVLKTISGKPWVADFQDPWSEPYVSYFPSPFHRKIAQHIERAIFNRADHVIVTTDAVKDIYAEMYPAADHSSISVIPNGFDPDPFQIKHFASRRSSFRITHFGAFWGARSPLPFLRGLAKAIKMNSRLAECIEVKFLGSLDPKYFYMTQQMLTTYGLVGKVFLEGFLPYLDGVGTLLDSDVLLLVLDNTEFGRRLVPCKLLDYLAAARPVLALAPDGEAARIVRRARAGLVVDPDDVCQIAHAIVQLYKQWQDGVFRSAIDKRYAGRFSYQETTKSFVSILNRVMQP